MPDIHTYNTWGAFVRAADQTNDLNPKQRISRDVNDGHWAGTRDWDDTMQLALRGWPDGLRRIRDQVHIIERFLSPKQPRLELTHAVRGPGILDFDHYTQGRPDSWVVWEPISDTHGVSARIVPIVFNLSASSGISAEVLFRRGAAVCALVDILEYSDIRVEILLVDLTRYGQREHLYKVMLKHSEDTLDLDRVAFALCNAATERRLMFSIQEQTVTDLPYEYGAPSSWHEDGAINLDSASLYIRNEADMVPWLVKQLAGYGIEVDE